MKAFAKKFYNSKQWRDCRDSYISSVHGLCENCLAKGIVRPGKILHHKTILTMLNIENPEATLNWNNLEYRCDDCHNKIHGNAKAIRDGLRFDNGDVVEAR